MPRPRPNRTEASAGTPSSTWSCFDNRRHRVLAMENGCAGQIHAQPQDESACWRGQPVGLMACRSGVPQVDVDGAVGIFREAGPIADAVPIDGIRHEAFFRVSHSQRPERVVGRKTARRKGQDEVVLSGEHDFILHFPPGGLPPNDAFWSLTMADAKERFVANPINRYSVGDRSGLAQNPDGSVDIYLRNAAPAGHQSNWLPAPAGRFVLWLRVYMPGAAILHGEYTVPPVVEARPSR